MKSGVLALTLGMILVSTAPLRGVQAGEELNLYSSRHYQTDEALYEAFTKQTGITLNRIEGKGDELIERIRNEGVNSPADLLITVDAGRLWRAEQAGLFQPVHSQVLEARIPANLRHPKGLWFGFSSRARLIFYNKSAVRPGEVARYEDLADPKWQDRICVRSSSNIYNQSLMGAMIAAHGAADAEAWATAVTGNFARKPVGGDTDQLRGAAVGECDVAIANSYYYARLKTSKKAADRELAESLGVVFPNQDDRGTHINISGAGLLKHAPHEQAAIRFLEYLASPEAQSYFADGNNEYPVVRGVAANSVLESLGAFKSDSLNVAVYGENQPTAQRIFDRAGWR